MIAEKFLASRVVCVADETSSASNFYKIKVVKPPNPDSQALSLTEFLMPLAPLCNLRLWVQGVGYPSKTRQKPELALASNRYH